VPPLWIGVAREPDSLAGFPGELYSATVIQNLLFSRPGLGAISDTWNVER